MKVLQYNLFKLNEDKKSDFMSSFSNVSSSDLESIWNIDPSSTKKYINKLTKFFIEGYSISLLENLIKIYDSLVLRDAIEIKDINKFNNFQQFEDAVLFADSKKSKSSLKRDIKKNEEKHDLIFENNKCKIYRIFSHKSSCILGKGSKWCITMTNTNQHWEYYNSTLNLDFYFVIMSSKVENRYSKMAVGIDMSNNPYEVRDLQDKSIPFEKVLSLSDAPKEIFVNTFLNPPINKEDLATKLLKLKIDKFYIKDDMKVVIKQNATFTKISYLPFIIEKVEGNFDVLNSKLENCDFFPLDVTLNVVINNCEFNFDEIFIPNCKNLFLKVETLKAIKNTYKVEQNITLKHINNEDLTSFNLPNIINGNLFIIDGTIKSLNGISNEVNGDCVLFNNKIKSLEYSPTIITKNYDISYNNITSLQYLPENIGGKLINKGNKI